MDLYAVIAMAWLVHLALTHVALARSLPDRHPPDNKPDQPDAPSHPGGEPHVITPPPALTWTRRNPEQYVATDAAGVQWSIDRHPTAPSRQGKNPDWAEKWWLHRLNADGSYPTDPKIHEECAIICGGHWTALHRHPEVLRYASVLAAGWDNACWRIQNGEPLAEQVMRRGDERAPLSALLGSPVMVHPQRLLDAELRASRFERRVYAAEQALRDAGLPIPHTERH